MTDAAPAPVAMILAAGLGTRLRPLTDHLPKPLLPIGGRPLLTLIIDRLQAAGCRDFVINTHHLPEQIDACIARRENHDRCRLLHEDTILGTGGALINARRDLEASRDFILHNGDVLSDAPLRDLIDRHRRSDVLATLLLVDWPPVNSVITDQDEILGFSAAVERPGARRLTYTGIAVFDAAFLDFLPPDMPCSLIDGLIAAIESRPGSVRCWAPDMSWSDLGTVERYRDALPEAEREQAAKRPLILLPATADRLLADNGFPDRLYAEPLALQGSDRRFQRLRSADRRAVLMQDDDPDERARFLAIGRFLFGAGLGGPAILDEDRDAGLVLVEDLGDRSLDLAATAADDPEDLYRRVIDRLLDLQFAGGDIPDAATDRVFDRATLLWETGYFREWFLSREIGLPQEDLDALDGIFEALADAVAAQPLCLMHRDFQSRNIIVLEDEIRLIDFQGMRRGPYAYDLMSLLRDPYSDIPSEARRRLMLHYHSRLEDLGIIDVTWDAFQRDAVLCGLQRIMQALGAYARLSIDKGRRFYRQYMGPGLEHLRQGLDEAAALSDQPLPADDLSRLSTVVQRAAGIMEKRGD